MPIFKHTTLVRQQLQNRRNVSFVDEAIPPRRVPESKNSNNVQAQRKARQFFNLNKERRFEEIKK